MSVLWPVVCVVALVLSLGWIALVLVSMLLDINRLKDRVAALEAAGSEEQ